MSFGVRTQLHGELIDSISLDVIRFHLYVYAEDFLVPRHARITRASLGGYLREPVVSPITETHVFSLDESESAELLERFTDNEVVDFELIFANGDVRTFRIYPSGDRTFYVWAEIFRS